MRIFGFILSILFHLGVFAVALFWVTGQSTKVDMDRPVYTVDIVSLAPPAAGKRPMRVSAPPEPKAAPEPTPAKAPEPVKEIKPEPKDEVKPEPRPEPKPEPPKAEAKDISEKKKEQKVVKKAKEKPQPKPAPKPQKTAAQLRAEAMSEVRKTAKSPEELKRAAIQQELAAIRQKAGEEVYSDASEGSEGVAGGEPGGTGSGLRAVYGSIVGEAIKKNWRYPALAGDKNLMSTVEIDIAADGKILGSRVIEGSRNTKFDSSILRAIKETEYVTPPTTVRDRVVRINFNSQELSE